MTPGVRTVTLCGRFRGHSRIRTGTTKHFARHSPQCRGEDSNLRPPVYETGELTTALPRHHSDRLPTHRVQEVRSRGLPCRLPPFLAGGRAKFLLFLRLRLRGGKLGFRRPADGSQMIHAALVAVGAAAVRVLGDVAMRMDVRTGRLGLAAAPEYQRELRPADVRRDGSPFCGLPGSLSLKAVVYGAKAHAADLGDSGRLHARSPQPQIPRVESFDFPVGSHWWVESRGSTEPFPSHRTLMKSYQRMQFIFRCVRGDMWRRRRKVVI